MITSLLKRFRKYRKAKYFSSPLFQTKKQYAFIGVGMHSLTNLYPVIRHFGIKLKYIQTQSSSWENEMKRMFPNTKFTNNINDLLSDSEVENIFISSEPSSHFELLKSALGAGKKVFVEKPPCDSLSSLHELIKISNERVCKVALQRRYWPANKYITGRIKSALSYNYVFQTGSYMGDDLTELFIHPLDYCITLFGKATISSIAIKKDDSGRTIQLHLAHSNGVTGLVELSTQHSWTSTKERMQINCKKQIFELQYPTHATAEQKPARVMNVPAERILNQPVITKQYFSANNFILPVAELNTIYLQGFLSEIESFISIAENNSGDQANDLPGLENLYTLFEEIRKHKDY